MGDVRQNIAFLNVSRETLDDAESLYQKHFDRFEEYLNQLLWWNQKTNLVSRDVSRETVRDHVIHSLIPSTMGLFDQIETWIDAGTGGGLPGIPLAIAESEKRWVLNDISGKKVAAVKQIIHHLVLDNAMGKTGPLKKMKVTSRTGIITKHAFSVENLMEQLQDKPWKKVIMYKGAEESAEQLEQCDTPCHATIAKFDFNNSDSFYSGKALLILESLRKMEWIA